MAGGFRLINEASETMEKPVLLHLVFDLFSETNYFYENNDFYQSALWMFSNDSVHGKCMDGFSGTAGYCKRAHH
jgi:hypothetical protein